MYRAARRRSRGNCRRDGTHLIGADNTVTVRVPGPESGTGNSTQAAMFVAEELGCSWDNVRVEPISFNRNTREGNLYLGAT